MGIQMAVIASSPQHPHLPKQAQLCHSKTQHKAASPTSALTHKVPSKIVWPAWMLHFAYFAGVAARQCTRQAFAAMFRIRYTSVLECSTGMYALQCICLRLLVRPNEFLYKSKIGKRCLLQQRQSNRNNAILVWIFNQVPEVERSNEAWYETKGMTDHYLQLLQPWACNAFSHLSIP